MLDRIEVLALLPTYRLACVSAGLKSRGEIFLAMSVTDGGALRLIVRAWVGWWAGGMSKAGSIAKVR